MMQPCTKRLIKAHLVRLLDKIDRRTVPTRGRCCAQQWDWVLESLCTYFIVVAIATMCAEGVISTGRQGFASNSGVPAELDCELFDVKASQTSRQAKSMDTL